MRYENLVRSPLKIGIVMGAKFPVRLYGGAERAAYYLAKGLSELGQRVTLICSPGSKVPFVERVVSTDEKLPEDLDVLQVYSTPNEEPSIPYVVCIQGNGKPGERFLKNTVFISKNHAERHGSTEFVYNGIDPSEYTLTNVKDYKRFVFLAKASWPVKNLRGAIDIAKHCGVGLDVLGGEGGFFDSIRFPWVRFFGMVGGSEKLNLLGQAGAMVFPVLWDEPFGIAVIESMAVGTPVFSSPFGSLPEIVGPSCGRVCSSLEEFVAAAQLVRKFDPEEVRNRVDEKFSHLKMAEGFLAKYRRVLRGEALNGECPKCPEDALAEKIYRLQGVRDSFRVKFKRVRQA